MGHNLVGIFSRYSLMYSAVDSMLDKKKKSRQKLNSELKRQLEIE